MRKWQILTLRMGFTCNVELVGALMTVYSGIDNQDARVKNPCQQLGDHQTQVVIYLLSLVWES
jgi:hypothetical protein